MHLTRRYNVFVCQQNDFCTNLLAGYCGLSENGHCFLVKLCPVGFLVVCWLVLLQSVVMSYVECGDDG